MTDFITKGLCWILLYDVTEPRGACVVLLHIMGLLLLNILTFFCIGPFAYKNWTMSSTIADWYYVM